MKKLLIPISIALITSQAYAFNLGEFLQSAVTGSNQPQQQNQQYQQYPNQYQQQQGYYPTQQQGYYPPQQYQQQQYPQQYPNQGYQQYPNQQMGQQTPWYLQNKQTQRQSYDPDLIYKKVYEIMVGASNELDPNLVSGGFNPNECTMSSFGRFDVSQTQFNKDTKNTLPTTTKPYGLFSVDTVGNLEKSVPPSQTIISIPTVEEMELITQFPTSQSMRKNWTGMIVTKEIANDWNAEKNRKNITLQSSGSMKEYVFNSIAALGNVISKKPQYQNQMEVFMKNAITLYSREVVSCIFDAK